MGPAMPAAFRTENSNIFPVFERAYFLDAAQGVRLARKKESGAAR